MPKPDKRKVKPLRYLVAYHSIRVTFVGNGRTYNDFPEFICRIFFVAAFVLYKIYAGTRVNNTWPLGAGDGSSSDRRHIFYYKILF